MSWALYLRYEEADFSEYVTSFTDEADAYAAQEEWIEKIENDEEDDGDLPIVIIVEEP
jgi:hypothetical protein